MVVASQGLVVCALHRELAMAQVAQKSYCNGHRRQISGWLKRQKFPETGQDMQISHEAIYRSLFVQTRGVLKKELTAALAHQTSDAPPQKPARQVGGRRILDDMVSIRDRPAEAEDRAVPGHWEGDLLAGANDTHIATLIERTTASFFTMLVKLPAQGHDDGTVAALAKRTSASCP